VLACREDSELGNVRGTVGAHRCLAPILLMFGGYRTYFTCCATLRRVPESRICGSNLSQPAQAWRRPLLPCGKVAFELHELAEVSAAGFVYP